MTREDIIAELNEIEQVGDAARKHIDVARDCFTRRQEITGRTHIEKAIAQLEQVKVRLEYL